MASQVENRTAETKPFSAEDHRREVFRTRYLHFEAKQTFAFALRDYGEHQCAETEAALVVAKAAVVQAEQNRIAAELAAKQAWNDFRQRLRAENGW